MGDYRTSASPCFLRVLTSRISEYLARYICKKGISRNDCVNQLRDIFFVNNHHVGHEIRRYKSEEKKAYAIKCRAKKQVAQKAAKKQEQLLQIQIFVNESVR